MGAGLVEHDDEDAKTLTKDPDVQVGEDGESPSSLAEPLPGLADLLGANLRGELHGLGPGMIIADKWELLELLGEGSFGKVYEARHVTLGHRMAIKVLAGEKAGPKAKQRFLEEAQLMAGMSSEHLIRASDYGELPDGSPYFVMDLVKGKSLRHWLGGPLALGRAVEIGEQILAGLVEVHRRGVVHGDIKPENVVIGEDDDKARLLDFGLAQTSADEPEGLGGTPHYMAPEMLLDRAPSSVRTDVYAAGVVLYEMLTGLLPRGHLGMDVTKIRAEWTIRRRADPVLMHCKEVPEEQREALETLDKLVMEALAPEPTARPKSAVPMLEEVRRLRKRLSPEALAPTMTAVSTGAKAADTEVKTTQPFRPVEASRRVSPRRVIAVAGVVAVAVLLGWWAWPKGSEGEPRQGEPPAMNEGRAIEGRAIEVVETEKPLGAEELEKARGGILVAVPEGVSDATRAGYERVCEAFDGDRPIVDGALPVLCRRVPLGIDALLELAETVEVKVVVFVGGGEAEEIEVRTTSHSRGNAVLPRLDGLPLPRDPASMELVAPVLRAVVGANTASGRTGAEAAEIPSFDWKKVGARWGGLAEWLRRQQEHEPPSDQDVERRRELALALEDQRVKARGREGETAAAFHRDLAMLVWATSMTCHGSERLLDELAVAGKHPPGIRVAALLERVDCLLEGDDPASQVQQAEALLTEALAASGEAPCVRVDAIGSISRIDAYKGTTAGWDALAKELPGPEQCEAGMWSKAYAVRGDALVSRGEWCEAAKAYALAREALPTTVDPLLNWAEYDWKCEPKGRASRQALLDALRDALASERFERPQQRVSLAYLRWWLSREPADAQRVLDEHAKVPVGEPALLEGVASDLEEEICAGKEGDACSRRILARGKRADDAERLRSSLGLR